MTSAPPDAEFGLELNEHHQNALVGYMRFARYLRSQKLRAVDDCFEDVKVSRFLEDTYTQDEVTDIINGLSTVVKGEVESELINMAHTNVLLLQQLCLQAEKWHLKLQINTADLENRDLLEKIKDFEDQLLSQTVKPSQGSPVRGRLEPLNNAGSAALLQQEIDKLQEDNMKLRQRLKHIESQATSLLQDKNLISEDLKKTKDELGESLLHGEKRYETGVSQLSEELENAKLALEELQLSAMRQEDLELNLSKVGQELLKVQAQLEMAEKELEKKVAQTTAYINLKKMLHQKNELIKTLRRKLAKYEPDTDDPDN